MTVEDLEKELKSGILSGIYLLYGEETYFLESTINKIKKIFGELINGINYITIDEKNVSEIISDIETPAFGYNKKLIIVKNLGLFKRIIKNKDVNNIKDKLLNYLEENINIINDTVNIVFIEDSADKTKFLDFISKNGKVCNFEKMKPDAIIKKLKSICNSYKVNVSETTLKKLLEVSGTSMQELVNEIRKLIEYVGQDGTITEEDIENLSTKNIESVIFDLTDNLGSKNISKAIEVLNNLIDNKEPVQVILITLYRHFKKLYIIKNCEKENLDIIENLQLKPNQTFLVSKYKKQAQYFQVDVLEKILSELTKLDANSKSGLINLQVGLESILCNYCY